MPAISALICNVIAVFTRWLSTIANAASYLVRAMNATALALLGSPKMSKSTCRCGAPFTKNHPSVGWYWCMFCDAHAGHCPNKGINRACTYKPPKRTRGE